MNEERFDLKEIELELFQVKEVLRCILHTIIFNRALGLVKPREIDCEVFENVSYARVDDVHIHRMVETGIERFHQALEKSPTDHTGQVCLGLYEKQMKKNWFSSKEEKVFWERWILPINITKEKPKTQAERDRRHAARSQAILDRLVYIIQCVNEKKDHIPPLNQQSTTVGVHFDISFTTGSATDESWGDSLKRMLKQGPPLLVKQP